MRYASGCFARLPFDEGGSLAKPKTQHARQAWGWFKDHASLIGLAMAVAI